MDRLKEFFKEIYEFEYVVMRNFENLPEDYEVGNHKDLDIFCSDLAKTRMKEIALKYPEIPIDIFSPEDDYYPEEIAETMLEDRATIRDVDTTVYIPNSRAYFFSLFYHNSVHKENGTYGKEREQLCLKPFRPIKLKEEGVGYSPEPNENS